MEKRTYCPICGKEGGVVLKRRKEKISIEGCDIEYRMAFYYCNNCHNEFEDGETLDRNVSNISLKMLLDKIKRGEYKE